MRVSYCPLASLHHGLLTTAQPFLLQRIRLVHETSTTMATETCVPTVVFVYAARLTRPPSLSSPPPAHEADTQMADTQPQDSRDASTPAPEEPAKAGRKRPRIDMATDAGQRKRGKSMFALALGTLTKAKNEDRARNQSEAVRPTFV